MFWQLCGTLFLFSVANTKWFKHNVTVSTNGNDSPGCLKNASTPCLTLDYVFHGVLNQNSTLVIIQPGYYYLNSSFIFWYTEQFGIIGASQTSQEVTIDCTVLAGLSFIYSEDITIKYVTMSSCGALHNSTSRRHPRFLTGLFLVNCIDLTLNYICIKDGPGIGIQLYDVTGTVKILNSHFLRNGNKTQNLTNITGFVNSGGGLYLEFTYMGGLWPFDETTNYKYQKNGMFQLFNLTFEENVAPKPNISDSVVVPNASDHVAFGRGGGISMFVKGRATNNTFEFNGCLFNKNYAVWGGGYFVEFHDKTQSNQVMFEFCQFNQNTAKFGGGGVRAGLITINKSRHIIPNIMNFKLCHFKQNKAILGGAISLYGTTKTSYMVYPERSYVNFTSCLVEENCATIGSAFGLALWNINNFRVGHGLPIKVFIMNCNITKNKVIFTEDKQVHGSGALYSNGMPTLLKNMKFTSNHGTALVLDNVVVQIIGNVLFKNNSGQNGGAAALYGTSKFSIAKQAHLIFVNNTCLEYGGAIYVQTTGPQMVAFKTTELNLHGCFFSSKDQDGFSPEEWDFNVTFQGNKGPHNAVGHSVFATTLQFCRQPDENRINNITLQWKSFHYLLANGSRSNMTYEIVTSPVKMEVNEAEWNVTADKTFSPTLKLIDEKNNSVYGIIDIKFSPKSQVTLSPPSTYYLAKDRIQSLKIQAKPFTHFNVSLFTVYSQLVSHSIKNVHIRQCSPGFVPEENTCKCNVLKDIGISRCEDNEQNLFLVNGYWGGYVQSKSEEFVTSPCPYNYCHCSTSNNHPSSNGECFFNMSGQCYGNRQGRLCGECKENFTLKVGDDNCVPLDDCQTDLRWLGYLILLILFLTILVLVIMVINFDPFSAYLNAWLYSYQVILLLLPESLKLDPFLLFIVGLANVRVIGFGGVCMWSRMDDLQKLAFNYLLPVFVIFCLFILNRLALVCQNNCFTRRLTQKSTARAFCTLFVLSYSTVTSISMNILHPMKIGNKYSVFLQGTEDYFGSYHIIFAIPAILLIIFVGILFPLMLIRRQWFSYIDSGLTRLLLDNFQNPFRDGYKWCSGFYFVSRFILLVVSAIPPGALKVSMQQSVCSIVLTVFVLCRPYDDSDGLISFKVLNISDAVLLCNLCLLASFSGALSGIYATRSYYNAFKVVIYMLGYVPLIFFLCIVVYFVWIKYTRAHVVLEDLMG